MSKARLYRVSAVVIRQRSFGEADQVIVLFTRERGKLAAVAKSSRKSLSKLAGGLQLFYHLRALLAAGRSLDVITQVQPIDTFLHLREDMVRFAHACYLCELVDSLTEEQAPDEMVFELLIEGLRALDGAGDPSTIARGFELRLFTHLGYGPELDLCVSCGAKVKGKELGFSAPGGGVLCGRCRAADGATPLTGSALQAMKDLIALPLEELAKRRLMVGVKQELQRLMRAYVDYRVERPLKSAEFLR